MLPERKRDRWYLTYRKKCAQKEWPANKDGLSKLEHFADEGDALGLRLTQDEGHPGPENGDGIHETRVRGYHCESKNFCWRAVFCSLMKTIMSIAKILMDIPFIKMRFLFSLPRTGATSLVTFWPEIWMEWKPSERTHIWPRKQHTF